MIDAGTLSKISCMALRETVSVAEAARWLHIFRNTAARWLAEPEMVQPTYPQRVTGPGLLDAFNAHLDLWLNADSHRGKRHRCSIGVYGDSIRATGFTGSKNCSATIAAPGSTSIFVDVSPTQEQASNDRSQLRSFGSDRARIIRLVQDQISIR